MQLLLAPFQGPLQFAIFTIASVIGGGFVFIFARAAMASEGRSPSLVKAMTNPNTKFLFAFLGLGWAIVFGIGLQLVPHEGANSPYGGMALIAMFSGFFILMGLLWSVIGD